MCMCCTILEYMVLRSRASDEGSKHVVPTVPTPLCLDVRVVCSNLRPIARQVATALPFTHSHTSEPLFFSCQVGHPLGLVPGGADLQS